MTGTQLPQQQASEEESLKRLLVGVEEMDKKIQWKAKQMVDNRKFCNSEVLKLQKHYEAIISKLTEIRNKLETKLKGNLDEKNAEISETKSGLEKKRKGLIDLAKFLEENHVAMSDYSLIESLRNLNRMSKNVTQIENCSEEYRRNNDIEIRDKLLRYRRGDINEEVLESMMGQTFDLDNITIKMTDSFGYGDDLIDILVAIDEDTCIVHEIKSNYFERFNKRNKKKEKFYVHVNDACATDNGDVYVTDYINESVVRLSPDGKLTTVFITAPLVAKGICQSTDGGLLVTLEDKNSKRFQPNSFSRRLVRHVTLTGDVIREYEYQEDGQTRLFTLPYRVTQNGNNDICVVNWTDKRKGDLMILFSSGVLKSVFAGKNLGEECVISSVVCDSHHNIIICDTQNMVIALLNPDGEFMKYLLASKILTCPTSISLYNSKLWIFDETIGHIRVFQYAT